MIECNERTRIGKRVKELRESAQLSQQQLADAAGILRPNLARIETGKYNSSLDTLEKIASALGLQVDFCQKD